MFLRSFWTIIIVLFITLPGFAQEITIPFHPVPNMPYFQSPELTIDSAEYDTLMLRIESKQKGTARLFWAIHYDPQFNPPKSIWFSVKRGDHDYYFDIPTQNPNWLGWVKGFLVYPETDPAKFEVKFASITRGNIGTKIRSGWQEFWGPSGRIVIGSTINLTPSSSIFGHSVNTYIYWLTAILFLLAFAWKRSFDTAGRWAICFALGAWVLLGINADINYFNIFRDNFSKYFGKTIEEKHAIAYGKDYYDFLVFARDKLPAEPVHFGVLSSRYAPELQPRIFLVPHVLVEPTSSKAEYLLLFNPTPEQLATAKGFRSYAQLDKNAYILKRKL